jgi:hypothetical protein
MSQMSNYVEERLLNTFFSKTPALTSPADTYAGLYTSTVGDDNSGTEVSGNGYARQRIYWRKSINRRVKNTRKLIFPLATPSGWGTITHWGILDASSGGNLLYWGSFSPSLLVGAEKQATIPTETLIIEFDPGGITTKFANRLLDHSLGIKAYTAGSIYIDWLSASANDLGGGTSLAEIDVTGANIERELVQTWNAAVVSGTAYLIDNTGAETSDPLGLRVDFGTVVQLAVYHGSNQDTADSAWGGDLLFYGDVDTQQDAFKGDQLRVPGGGFNVTFD